MRELGAKRIFLVATFGLFCNGLEVFDQAYADGVFDKVFTTNLIYRTKELKERDWYCEVNTYKYIALFTDTLNHDMSVCKLLAPADKIHALLDKYNAGQL